MPQVPRFTRSERFERWWEDSTADGLLCTEIEDFEKAILAWETKTPQPEVWGVSLSADSWRELLWQARYLTITTTEQREKHRADAAREAATGARAGAYAVPASMHVTAHNGNVSAMMVPPLDLSLFFPGGPASVEAQQQRDAGLR